MKLNRANTFKFAVEADSSVSLSDDNGLDNIDFEAMYAQEMSKLTGEPVKPNPSKTQSMKT